MSRLATYKLSFPISLSTIHSWMILLGCKCERATQSFYTDGHERSDVVEGRVEYIKQKRKLALRQPLWVRVERASVSRERLAQLDALKETGEEAFYAEVYDCEVGGKACIEFHVDLLPDGGSVDRFDEFRAILGPEGGHYSVRFDAAAAFPCEAHHTPDKCKCGKRVRHIGQDESVYKAYAREGKEWVIQGVSGMRKKVEGPGEMVSAFQDEKHGFGLPLTDEQLQMVNSLRNTRGQELLNRSPVLRFLIFGKYKGGFWRYPEFKKQVEDVLDVLQLLEPDLQVVCEVDHSSGHARQREDGLHVSNMNVKFGGKQKMLRESVMTEGCLGPEKAVMYFARGKWSTEFSRGATKVDLKQKMGDTHISTFASDSPARFYEWDAPRHDTPIGVPTRTAGGKVEEGYVGKPKGEKHILWERGWWKPGMSAAANASPEMNIEAILSKLPDFKNERTALQHVVESRGHILLLSPKCHPEVAGVGIEYSRGMSKQKFRREINDEVPKHLHDNIVKSMCASTILTLGRVRRFARRTQDYCRAYRSIALSGAPVQGKAGIEKMREKQKAHRNILDMEPGFIDSQ